MPFDPHEPPIDVTIWKPSAGLQSLAVKRCSWVNSEQVHALEGSIWLQTIIVGCYYQGLADGIRHISRKLRKRPERKAMRELHDHKVNGHCEDALMWLQKRTRDRMARGVEGTNVK